jgi:hypothetical protein
LLLRRERAGAVAVWGRQAVEEPFAPVLAKLKEVRRPLLGWQSLEPLALFGWELGPLPAEELLLHPGRELILRSLVRLAVGLSDRSAAVFGRHAAKAVEQRGALSGRQRAQAVVDLAQLPLFLRSEALPAFPVGIAGIPMGAGLRLKAAGLGRSDALLRAEERGRGDASKEAPKEDTRKEDRERDGPQPRRGAGGGVRRRSHRTPGVVVHARAHG